MSVSSSTEASGLAGVVGGFAPLDSGLLVPRSYLPGKAAQLDNLSATAAPTVNDDVGDGYGIGSLWYDTTNDAVWTCTDASSGAAVWRGLSYRYITLGPYFFNDLAGTANNDCTPMVFNTATVVNRPNVPFRGDKGYVHGASMIADGARATGTATLKVMIGGVQTDFAADACQLNGTNTDRVSVFVNLNAGARISGNSSIQPRVVTSGWTPITANLSVLLHVAIE